LVPNYPLSHSIAYRFLIIFNNHNPLIVKYGRKRRLYYGPSRLCFFAHAHYGASARQTLQTSIPISTAIHITYFNNKIFK
jgi:hypothetical protein